MFAVLHFPQFALQAALRPAPELWARPIALVDPTLSTPRVCDLTEPARQQGVEPGQTPTQALARCREVTIRHRSLAQETAATDAILQCAHGFSPHIEQTAIGVVTLDLRGLSELADDRAQLAPDDASMAAGRRDVSPMLQRWAARLQSALASLHLTARLGLGATPNIARHAAQWGGFGSDQPAHGYAEDRRSPTSPTSPTGPTGWNAPCIVTDARAFIVALPVAALGPSTDVASGRISRSRRSRVSR
jgi:protein ImuB